MILTYLARTGLFVMIAGAGIVPWIIEPMTTFAYITAAIALTIAGFIFYDRWVK